MRRATGRVRNNMPAPLSRRRAHSEVIAWHPHGAFAIAALYFVSHYWVGSLSFLKHFSQACDFPSHRRGTQFVSRALRVCLFRATRGVAPLSRGSGEPVSSLKSPEAAPNSHPGGISALVPAAYRSLGSAAESRPCEAARSQAEISGSSRGKGDLRTFKKLLEAGATVAVGGSESQKRATVLPC